MSTKTMLLKCRLFDFRDVTDLVAEVPTRDHGKVHFFVPMSLTRPGGVMVDVLESGDETSTIALTGESCSSEFWPNVFVVMSDVLEEST
jgi:hypothetical protein